jgi:small-conductance mechanosensitive channel
MNTLFDGLAINFLKTLVALSAILLIWFIIDSLIKRRVKQKRLLLKYRIRTRSILIIFFIMIMAVVWVEGLSYLLAVLGIISAALTITQKENLMNLFGFFIIQWRDLFSEEDYIEIGPYSGYVNHIGVLYFTLDEASKAVKHERTGRKIKVPNMMVSIHPIINFSTDLALLEINQSFIFTFHSPFEEIKPIFDMVYQELIDFYRKTYGYWSIVQRDKYYEKTDILYRVKQHKPAGIEALVRFYCLKANQTEIEMKLNQIIIDACNQNRNITLSEER